jgi:XamI restriction endonuclease
MPVNRDKPDRWKEDVAQSVDLYNEWFLNFAPGAFRETRVKTTEEVKSALKRTDSLRNVKPELLREQPSVIFTLRMSTAPPIARDRLVGLANISKSLVLAMEKGLLPPRMSESRLMKDLECICRIIMRLADADIFPWLGERRKPSEKELYRAATIVADRLCGAQANPIIRNAQEQRQLALMKQWLEARGYEDVTGQRVTVASMEPGTFAIHLNVPGVKEDGASINIPIDMVVKSKNARRAEFPLLIEAKSAGDFTNTNKRRKEEATKMADLRRKYGSSVPYILFLCGYFDSGYLGYEAAEGIDWVWEHRIDDLAEFGV